MVSGHFGSGTENHALKLEILSEPNSCFKAQEPDIHFPYVQFSVTDWMFLVCTVSALFPKALMLGVKICKYDKNKTEMFIGSILSMFSS